MGRRYRERRIFSQNQAEVRRAAERAVYELGLAVNEDNTDWELQASRSKGDFTWGERIKLLMATSPGGGTQVLVESRLVFGFVDWGINKKNVETLFSSMETVLGPGETAPTDP